MIHDDLIAAGIKLTPEQAKARRWWSTPEAIERVKVLSRPGAKPWQSEQARRRKQDVGLAQFNEWKQKPENKARLKTREKERNQKPENIARQIANDYKTPIEIPNRPRPDRCECCGEISARTLHLDHDHKTGRFRGWCCTGCNNGSGLADNPERLHKRLAFLEWSLQPGPIKWAYPKEWQADKAA